MDEVQMEHRLAEVEQRSKSNTHRIDELAKEQKTLNELATSVAMMTQEQKDIREDISEVKKDVKMLTNLPAKRWNDVIEKIVWLVLGGAVAALLAQAGLHV
nr:MAG TPA: Flagella accessory protein C (FlaC) [Caudoviricetes sp.]